MSEIRDFKEALAIDRYKLEEVATGDAQLYADWGLAWADAVALRDQLKDKLALVRGQCDQDIRENPEDFGWQKPEKAPSEAFINSAIMTHEKYIAANKEFQEAQHDVNILAVGKESFDRRDRRISDLVKLWLGGYYSQNRKLGEGPKEVVEEAFTKAQTEGLEGSPRLARRKVNPED